MDDKTHYISLTHDIPPSLDKQQIAWLISATLSHEQYGVVPREMALKTMALVNHCDPEEADRLIKAAFPHAQSLGLNKRDTYDAQGCLKEVNASRDLALALILSRTLSMDLDDIATLKIWITNRTANAQRSHADKTMGKNAYCKIDPSRPYAPSADTEMLLDRVLAEAVLAEIKSRYSYCPKSAAIIGEFCEHRLVLRTSDAPKAQTARVIPLDELQGDGHGARVRRRPGEYPGLVML